MTDLRRWRGLAWRDRRLLLEALAAMVCWRLALAWLPFARLADRLHLRLGETVGDPPDAATGVAARVGWAVRAVAVRAPKFGTCLAQALAAMAMLRRRRVPATLYLGVRTATGTLAAHAWVRCAALIVTGEGGQEGFAPIASYAWPDADAG